MGDEPGLGFSFSRQSRLLKPIEFQRVFKQGRRIHSAHLLLIACTSDTTRLGLAIAKKHAAKAVVRNQIKRRIRASFRLMQRNLPAVDIVLISKPGIDALKSPALFKEINYLWRKLAN